MPHVGYHRVIPPLAATKHGNIDLTQHKQQSGHQENTFRKVANPYDNIVRTSQRRPEQSSPGVRIATPHKASRIVRQHCQRDAARVFTLLDSNQGTRTTLSRKQQTHTTTLSELASEGQNKKVFTCITHWGTRTTPSGMQQTNTTTLSELASEGQNKGFHLEFTSGHQDNAFREVANPYDNVVRTSQ